MQASHAGAITAPVTAPLSEVKAAKNTLEVEIQRLICEYEARYDCRVVGLRVDYDKRESDGAWRTTGIRADIQL